MTTVKAADKQYKIKQAVETKIRQLEEAAFKTQNAVAETDELKKPRCSFHKDGFIA